MRYTYIRQHDSTDCAAACLAMICLHYKKETSITKLRDIMGTDLKGTNLVGLSKCVHQLGFNSQAVKVTKEQFKSKYSLPAIAHVITKQGLLHFVVVFKITKKHVVIGDPATDLKKVPIDEFLEGFTGNMLLMVPTTRFNTEKTDKKSIFLRYIDLLKPQKKLFFFVILASVILTLIGIASVILCNDTTSVSINVFIKNVTTSLELNQEVLIGSEPIPLASAYGENVMDMLAKKIVDSTEEDVYVSCKEISCVTSKALEQLYKLKKNLRIDYDGFIINIYGEKIDDYGNDLNTDFVVSKSKKYKESYVFNVKNKLPGKVKLKLKDKKYNKKYIYVYNNNSKKYVLLADNKKNYVELKNNEEYLFTDNDLDKYIVDMSILVGIVVIIGVTLIIYVVTKRRYCFGKKSES